MLLALQPTPARAGHRLPPRREWLEPCVGINLRTEEGSLIARQLVARAGGVEVAVGRHKIKWFAAEAS